MLRSKVKRRQAHDHELWHCPRIEAHSQVTEEAEKSAMILFKRFAKLYASSARPKLQANLQALDEADSSDAILACSCACNKVVP